MSVSHRRVISTAKTRLLSLLDDIPKAEIDRSKAQVQLPILKAQIAEFVDKIKQSINTIEAHEAKWQEIIDSLNDPKEELELFDQIFESKNGQTGLKNVMDKAIIETDSLESELHKVELELSNASPAKEPIQGDLRVANKIESNTNSNPPMENRPETQLVTEAQTNDKHNIPPAQIAEEVQEIQKPVFDDTLGYQQSFLRLPKLQLRGFDGDPIKWIPFWEQFKFSVHERTDLSSLQKFVYLSSLLDGAAKRSLDSLPISEAHYVEAISILRRRFGDSNKLLNLLNIKLAQTKPASTSVVDVRNYFESIELICRQLEVLEQDVNHPQVLLSIERNLPRWILQPVLEDKRRTKEDWTCKKLRESIDDQLTIREDAFTLQPNTQTPQKNRNGVKTNPVSRTEKKPRCIFCEGSHWSTECKKIQTYEARLRCALGQGRCRKCLGKHEGVCNSKIKCFQCKGDHHSALCKPKSTQTQSRPNESIQSNSVKTEVKKGALTIVKTRASNPKFPNKTENVPVFFDCGSQLSFIEEKLAKNLGLEPKRTTNLDIDTFGQGTQVLKTAVYTVLLHQTNGEKCPVTLYSSPQLIGSVRINRKKVTPSILIGADFFWNFLIKREVQNGRERIITTLGNTCSKPFNQNIALKVNALHLKTQTEPPKLEQLWALETLGITENPENDDDEMAIEQFRKSLKWDGERYEVGWPFKEDPPILTPNRSLAIRRLHATIKKLETNPELLVQYDAQLKDQIERGVAEPVSKSENKLTQYLPHHAVYRPEKASTRVRLVFDASAKMKGAKSLNENLYRGPVLLPDLAGILIRSRIPTILVSSDIEKAFWTIGLKEEDRDFTRYLWINDLSKPITESNISEFRFKRLPFGVISSPFLLSATINEHLKKSNSEVGNEIVNNTYVDNVILGAENAQVAIKKGEQAIELFRQIGMNLRQFMSNSEIVERHFGGEEEDQSKFFGIEWNRRTDEIGIKVPNLEDCQTKRQVTSNVYQIYDPLGLVSPCTLRAKRFIQDLWKSSKTWDDQITKPQQEDWQTIKTELTNHEIFIKRKISIGEEVTLHSFGDASEYAYSACVYVVSNHGSFLVFAKSRLAPARSTSIPRLELLAALIATRATKFVKDQLEKAQIEIKQEYLWSDSKCTLRWLKSKKILPKFIENRVNEIRARKLTRRYVPSEFNPADIGSRGSTFEELQESNIWWHGPSWLLNQAEWPESPEFDEPDTEDETSDSEEEAFQVNLVTLNEPKLENVIDISKFSNWTKLVNVIARILALARKKPWFECRKSAENLIMVIIQQNDPPTKEEIKNLNLQLINNLWVIRGRISNREPLIYLPTKSHGSRLIIEHAHKNSLHQGARFVLARLNQRFFIPRGTSTVKKVINHCVTCKKSHGLNFKLPKMPDLPNERTTRSRVFQHIGLDIAGPFKIKEGHVWILLITCFTTRATHIEILQDLSAKTALGAFRRFIARRGRPDSVLSDNGTQLSAVAKIVSSYWTPSVVFEIGQAIKQDGIKWTFTSPHSPWKGGLYERLIGLFKNSLKQAIGKKNPNLDEFTTFAVEVESLLNERPLTTLSDNGDVLRPIDFLAPKSETGAPILHDNDDSEDYLPVNLTRNDVLHQWRQSTKVLDKFWKLWANQYLSTLQKDKRISHNQTRGINRTPRIGEVVLMVDEILPRGEWHLARVEKLIKSTDGEIRTVEVKKQSGSTLQRSVAHLVPLEVEFAETEAKPHEEDEIQPQVEDCPPKEPKDQTTIPDQNQESNQKAKRGRGRPKKDSQQRVENHSNGIQTRRYNLRSRTLAPLWLIAVLVMLFGKAVSLECSSRKGNIVFAEECAKSAILIQEITNGTLCYRNHECSGGVTRIGINPDNSKTAYCGGICQCEPWAIACSHGDLLQESLDQAINWHNHLFEVCSMIPNEKCASSKTIQEVPQIELLDGTKLLVNTLNIVHEDHAIICIGQEDFPATGTPEFCALNKCQTKEFCTTNPCKICFIRAQERLKFRTKTGLVPIRAFGLKTVEFYDKPSTEKTCQNCRATCRQGGILATSFNTDRIEVNSDKFHTLIESPSENEEINLPPTLTAKRHSINVVFWAKGKVVNTFALRCPPNPFCEQITCLLCMDLMQNLQCFPTTKRIVLLVLISVTLSICLIVINLLGMFLRLCRLPLRLITQIVRFVLKSLMFCWKERPKRRERIPKRLIIVLSLYLMVGVTMACTEQIVVSANSTECKDQICKLTHQAHTELQIGDVLCLELKGGNNIEQLEIELTDISKTCLKRVDYFTRNTVPEITSIARCPTKGSCTNNVCASIQPNDAVPEFGSRINLAPGASRCEGIEGGIFNGCLLPTEACLFSKIWPRPIDQEVAIVYTCKWETHLTFTVREVVGETNTLVIHPGQTVNWKGIKLQADVMIEDTENHDLIVKQDQNSMIIVNHEANALVKCPSHESAKILSKECNFHPKCDCRKVDLTQRCNCEEMNSTPLPTKMFQVNNGTVNTKSWNARAVTTVSIERNIQITRDVNTRIELSNLHLTGCTECQEGALLEGECRGRNRMVSLECDSFSTTFPCLPQVSRHVEISSTTIDETCIVDNSNSTINVKGTLYNPVPFEWKGIKAQLPSSKSFVFQFPFSIFNFVPNTFVLVLVLIVCAVFLGRRKFSRVPSVRISKSE